MASKENQAADVPAVDTDFHLTLEEFCARLSSTDRRVELIGAFFKTEQSAGRGKASESEFSARFVAFCNQPA